MAIVAEYVDAAVVAALPASVGAAYSSGNATCRSSICRPDALHVWLVLVRAEELGQALPCAPGLWLGSSGWVTWQRGRLAMWGSYTLMAECDGSGEGVSDCSRAVVPVGRMVIGSE